VIFVVTLIVIGTGLRFYRIDTGLWFDEIQTLLDSVRSPLARIVTHFPSNNDHPLYSVLAHLSVSFFGESPLSLRLPSALFGVATLPLLYMVGVAISDRREAAAAAAILTVSYHHIWFSQNARGYTALLFCVLLATYALIRWLDTGRRGFLICYAVVTAAGSYAHLTMILVSVSHAVALGFAWLVSDRDPRLRTEWVVLAGAFVGAAVLTVFCYAPMVADVSAFFTTQTATATEVATPIWAIVAAVRGLQVGFGVAWAAAIGGLVFAAGAWSFWRDRPAAALLLLLPAPLTVVMALALDRPIFPRFVFFALGSALLVTVRGASVIGSIASRLVPGRLTPQQGALAMIALLTIGGVALSLRSLPYGYRYPKQDYESAVAFVERTKAREDVVVVIGEPATTPVQQYFKRSWARIHDDSELRNLRRPGSSVWVIYTFPSYIEANQPQLWAMVQNDCSDAGEFEGTVAGGTISVRRCQ
jgi:4-amino-4-deoxy-L-arabinose transferase-like glycosyltransferase